MISNAFSPRFLALSLAALALTAPQAQARPTTTGPGVCAYDTLADIATLPGSVVDV
jgi:hypothetical protein